ncbi:MAG: AAA family ATPase [Pseudomonadota bacterium]
MNKPLLIVLAGVNGAGKSTVGGPLLDRADTTWYNPDAYARALMADGATSLESANSEAWERGRQLLVHAIATRTPHAFETTLGGGTITAEILKACTTHDVLIWFCGLSSPEMHIRRVRERVARGGHDIPEAKIRERFNTSRENLVRLMPHVFELQVFDNSAEAAADGIVPNPVRLLRVSKGVLVWPTDNATLAATPLWAQPLVEGALRLPRH